MRKKWVSFYRKFAGQGMEISFTLLFSGVARSINFYPIAPEKI